ncbi:MAG TPA: hypothetical protein DCG18_01130 [Richelia sp.]|nr:hypothetical protein [Richelia sp.]
MREICYCQNANEYSVKWSISWRILINLNISFNPLNTQENLILVFLAKKNWKMIVNFQCRHYKIGTWSELFPEVRGKKDKYI